MDFESPTFRTRETASSRSKPEPNARHSPAHSFALPVSLRLSWRGWECQNPDCGFRRPLRRLFYRRDIKDGIFLQNRWYCCLDCFQQAITPIFAHMIKLPDQPLLRPRRIPLGLLLLGRGVITEPQLRLALRTQRDSGNERLGRSLIRLGIVSVDDVSAALAAQWGCAVFPLERDRRYRQCCHMVPLALLEAAQMVPVHYLEETHLLFLAFSRDVDHTTLYSIERLIGSRTEPCVVSESAMDDALDEIRAASRPAEIVFETIRDSREMARTIRDYAVKFGAEELFIARPRRFLWVRLKAHGQTFDLMFRLPETGIS